MKLNKIIIYAVSGLFALSLVFFVLAMGYTSINSFTSAGLNEKLAEFEKKAAEAAKQEEAQREWRNIEKVLQKFKNEYMMNMDEFKAFRSDLPATFMSNRLQLMAKKKIDYSYKDLFKNTVTKVNVTFTLTGNYVDFKKFIHQMTNEKYNKKMVLIRNIELGRRDQGDQVGDFIMEVYLVR